jgi:hypothetical protein
MGFGDQILATATVKKAFARLNRPVCIGNGAQVEWSEVFHGNPKISRHPYPGVRWVREFEGFRPYIDYAKSEKGRFTWNMDYRAQPGELYLTHEEKARYKEFDGAIYIEPNVKTTITTNKDWGFERWQDLVSATIHVRYIQGAGRRLAGVGQAGTETFRAACALLSNCSLFVGTDGGLHHAAGALGIPAIVLWSGYAPSSVLGYP